MVTSLTLASLLLVLLLCTAGANSSSSSSSTPPTKIGNGYRLISLGEIPDGGLVGHLIVNQKNNIYGPDLPHLQLFVKYVLLLLLQSKGYIIVYPLNNPLIFLFCDFAQA